MKTIPHDVRRLATTLLQLGVHDGLVAKAEEILAEKGENPDEWIELAVALREHEHYDAAMATYDAAIRRFPDYHVLWSNRGYVLLVTELYEEALRNFTKALELKPDYIYALSYRAAAYERMHEYEKAAAAFRDVLEHAPDHTIAWNSLGLCLLQLGDETEAVKCFEKSIQSDREYTDPLFNLAALLSSQKEYSSALRYISRLLEINPSDHRAEALREEIISEPESPRAPADRDTYVSRTDPSSSRSKDAGWRRQLYRADGTRRPDAEIVVESGKIGLRLALLQEAIQKRSAAGEIPVRYPLRLFLSYKWGSEEWNAWVATLAGKLRENGWDVVFDRYRDEELDRSVEEFVSRIATCRVFLALATPEYIAHAINPSDKPTWVFDEYQAAMASETAMYCIALTPGGDLMVPEPKDDVFRTSEVADRIFPEVPPITFKDGKPQFEPPAIIIHKTVKPRFEEVHAIPSDETFDAFLKQHIRYDGPLLGESEREKVVRELEALRRDDVTADSAVTRLRAQVEEHPFIHDAWRLLLIKLTELGQLSEALDALDGAIRNVHPWDDRLTFERERVDILNQCGRSEDAVKAAIQILETRPRDWVAHFWVGNRLDDCMDLWGARNHLLISCESEHASAEAFNTLGVVYLGLGFTLRARQCFEAALQINATMERAKRNLSKTWADQPPHPHAEALQIEGTVTGCSHCPSVYPMTAELSVLCTACGGRHTAGTQCEYCSHDGFIPPMVGRVKCPTCRTGTLQTKDRFDI